MSNLCAPSSYPRCMKQRFCPDLLSRAPCVRIRKRSVSVLIPADGCLRRTRTSRLCAGRKWLPLWKREIIMSNVNKKPTPLYNSVVRAPCPVCGHASYSSTGIHPQCAMQAADIVHIARVNARKLCQPVTANTAPRPFEKRCPRCRGTLPARSLACTCGHNFKP